MNWRQIISMHVMLSRASQMAPLLKNIPITPKAHVCWCYRTIELEIQSMLFGVFREEPWRQPC